MPEGNENTPTTPAAPGGPLEALASGRQGGQPAPSAPQGQQPQAAQPPAAATQPSGEQAPPWERDGQQFDPERAWNRIQGMQRDLEAARSRVNEFEQAAMTDQQRLEQRATTAEEAAATAQRDLARYRVAAAKGVPPDLLSGDSEEAMTAQADQLLAFRGEQVAPVPSFDGGIRTPSAGVDMNQEIRRRMRG